MFLNSQSIEYLILIHKILFLLFCLACDNGEIRVYNVDKERLSYSIESTRPGVPFSYVKWRPKLNYKAKNVFVTANAEGEVQHWHLTSG